MVTKKEFPRNLTELRTEMIAVARGEREASPMPAYAGTLMGALSDEALEIMRVIAQCKPRTVSELAEIVGRSQPNVTRSLQSLVSHQCVRLVREGRAVRPEMAAEKVTVNLRDSTYVRVPIPAE